jgi:hypothetical protein
MSSTGVAADVRERIMASRDRFWRPDDFSGSPAAVCQALTRLSRNGELARIRRGLYWRGRSTVLGMAPPPASRIARELANCHGTGPAGLSAALMLGLSTQVPRREVIAVPARVPQTDVVRLVSRAASTKRRSERLRPAEVALLEVLRDWDALVQVPGDQAARSIGRLMDSAAIRSEVLARASATEPPRVREHLAMLLARVGRPDAVRPARSAHRDLARA